MPGATTGGFYCCAEDAWVIVAFMVRGATEKFKHACPACGQHIEYTAEYCGHRIQCPTCRGSVVFPALPPSSATQKLRLQRDVGVKKRKPLFNLRFLRTILEFPHWKMVGACLVPFLVVGGLLVGAGMLKKANAEDTPAALPKAVTAPVGSDAWKKMTVLGQSQEQVERCVKMVQDAKAAVLQAEMTRDRVRQSYANVSPGQPQYSMGMRQTSAADQGVAQAEQRCNAARQMFDQAFQQYQNLGGQFDYRSQVPP